METPRSTAKLAIAMVAAAVVVGALVVIVVRLSVRESTAPAAWSPPFQMPPTVRDSQTTTATAMHPPAGAAPQDLSAWTVFGGIDARFSDSGHHVILDTHDTTQTWTTKWSGLIATDQSRCSLHIHARVRDMSHTAGVPGGYGIGLASLQQSELSGWAVQYDFGQQGYRIALYPSDGDVGLFSDGLDHSWHDIDFTVDEHGYTTESVDQRTVVQDARPSGCGHPVIRVWAGAAEFADLVIQ